MNTQPDKRDVKELTDDLKKVYKYGIKAYRTWDLFKTAKKYRAFLKEWIAGTDGSEQERAYTAYFNIIDGINYTDTDIC